MLSQRRVFACLLPASVVVKVLGANWPASGPEVEVSFATHDLLWLGSFLPVAIHKLPLVNAD